MVSTSTTAEHRESRRHAHRAVVETSKMKVGETWKRRMQKRSCRRLTRGRSWHGPASARQPSCLAKSKSSRRHATRIARLTCRRVPCRIGFGTWAPAVQLNHRSVSRNSKGGRFAAPIDAAKGRDERSISTHQANTACDVPQPCVVQSRRLRSSALRRSPPAELNEGLGLVR